MKTVKYLLITITFLFSNISFLFAQNTEGKEFWVTFGKNTQFPCEYPVGLDLRIRIVCGNEPTTGTIYFTHLNDSVSFSINANQIYDFSLNPTQRCASYNTINGKTNYSIRISTNEHPVTVYAANLYTSYSDVTNVLPAEVLGTDYYQISSDRAQYYSYFDAFAVIATQNNTELYQNDVYVTKLDAGEVYYHIYTDMTGYHITSTNPVAFFAVNQGTNVPSQATSGSSHLFQQLAPVNTWGKTFFVPVTNTTNDIVRIVVSQDSTTITQKGGNIRTGVPGAQTSLKNLQAGQFVELDVYLDSAGCYIQADKPVGVCSYIPSWPYSSNSTTPSQTWIPCIEQTVYKAFMAPFLIMLNSDILGINYALVVTPTSTKTNTTVSIGGALPDTLSGGSWYDNADAGISFYSMPLTEHYSTYTFSNSKGIIIFGYNNGIVNSIHSILSSYYFLAYSAMRTLDAAFYVNDIHYEDLKDTTFCSNNVNFRAEIENMGVEMDSLKWYINGIEKYTKLNHLEWDTTLSNGTYEITMWVRFENDTIITRTGRLEIVSCGTNSATFYVNNIPYDNLQDTVFCDKNVNFRAEIEGLNSSLGSLKWYIDEVPEPSAQDHLEWSKELDTGDHKIKMEVLFANNNTETLTCILKMNVFWIKMRNVRY